MTQKRLTLNDLLSLRKIDFGSHIKSLIYFTDTLYLISNIRRITHIYTRISIASAIKLIVEKYLLNQLTPA